MEIIRIGAMFHALSLLRPCSPARFCRLERFASPELVNYDRQLPVG